MIPRSSSTAFGCRKPSVVTRSTCGCAGQRDSNACRMRANVDLPTATDPATPITYGTRGRDRPEKGRRHTLQVLRRAHVQVEQPAQREVDGDDLVDLDPFVDALERIEILLAEGERGGCSQIGPLVAIEREVSIGHGENLRSTLWLRHKRQRKLLGAWYTPPELVDTSSTTCCAASSGAGAPGARARPGVRRRTLPVRGRRAAAAPASPSSSRDATSTRRARRDRRSVRTIAGDALAHDWGGETFDIVVGNPPFLSQMAAATTRGGASRHGGGPYADAAVEFLVARGAVGAP